MMRRPTLVLAVFAAVLLGGAERAPDPLADELLAEVERARVQPHAYVGDLREWRSWFERDVLRRPGLPGLVTNEGPRAVDEAIAFVRVQRPLPRLERDPALDRAAADHVADQSRTGRTGHLGSDGATLSDRVLRHGTARGMGENIAYGFHDAREAALQLIVDDGVASRGHRLSIYNRRWTRVGAACGPHPVWRQACVVVFAY
jgi:uncharacterized protein YkwD